MTKFQDKLKAKMHECVRVESDYNKLNNLADEIGKMLWSEIASMKTKN